MSILYISQNGITDHIGQSQVAPYLLGLARMGFKIHLLSAEKPHRDHLIESYKKQFQDSGIIWWTTTYRVFPNVLGQLFTQARLQYLAYKIMRKYSIKIVHCRSHPTALIGWQISDHYQIPFIFDFRDFYADGGIEKAKGFRRVAAKRIKAQERNLIRAASHIVCLTRSAQDVLTNWYFRDHQCAQSRFSVIPCCADFSHFDPSRISVNDQKDARSLLKISSKSTILCYLGTLGIDNLVDPMLLLFKQLLLVNPDSIFLFIANNGIDLVQDGCKKLEIPIDRIRFVSVAREKVPVFLSLATFSVLFYRSGLRSTGCSPTKLAELFAMNVPVIVNRGVGDLDSLISLEANGSRIVQDYEDDSLRSAVEDVLTWSTKNKTDIRARSSGFDLPFGVSSYAAIYHKLLVT